MIEEPQAKESYEPVTPPPFFTPTTEPFTPLSPPSSKQSSYTPIKQNPPFSYGLQREEVSAFFDYPNPYQPRVDPPYVRPSYPYFP